MGGEEAAAGGPQWRRGSSAQEWRGERERFAFFFFFAQFFAFKQV
jgi:hypothetical protein